MLFMSSSFFIAPEASQAKEVSEKETSNNTPEGASEAALTKDASEAETTTDTADLEAVESAKDPPNTDGNQTEASKDSNEKEAAPAERLSNLLECSIENNPFSCH